MGMVLAGAEYMQANSDGRRTVESESNVVVDRDGMVFWSVEAGTV